MTLWSACEIVAGMLLLIVSVAVACWGETKGMK